MADNRAKDGRGNSDEFEQTARDGYQGIKSASKNKHIAKANKAIKDKTGISKETQKARDMMDKTSSSIKDPIANRARDFRNNVQDKAMNNKHVKNASDKLNQAKNKDGLKGKGRDAVNKGKEALSNSKAGQAVSKGKDSLNNAKSAIGNTKAGQAASKVGSAAGKANAGLMKLLGKAAPLASVAQGVISSGDDFMGMLMKLIITPIMSLIALLSPILLILFLLFPGLMTNDMSKDNTPIAFESLIYKSTDGTTKEFIDETLNTSEVIFKTSHNGPKQQKIEDENQETRESGDSNLEISEELEAYYDEDGTEIKDDENYRENIEIVKEPNANAEVLYTMDPLKTLKLSPDVEWEDGDEYVPVKIEKAEPVENGSDREIDIVDNDGVSDPGYDEKDYDTAYVHKNNVFQVSDVDSDYEYTVQDEYNIIAVSMISLINEVNDNNKSNLNEDIQSEIEDHDDYGQELDKLSAEGKSPLVYADLKDSGGFNLLDWMFGSGDVDADENSFSGINFNDIEIDSSKSNVDPTADGFDILKSFDEADGILEGDTEIENQVSRLSAAYAASQADVIPERGYFRLLDRTVGEMLEEMQEYDSTVKSYTSLRAVPTIIQADIEVPLIEEKELYYYVDKDNKYPEYQHYSLSRNKIIDYTNLDSFDYDDYNNANDSNAQYVYFKHNEGNVILSSKKLTEIDKDAKKRKIPVAEKTKTLKQSDNPIPISYPYTNYYVDANIGTFDTTKAEIAFFKNSEYMETLWDRVEEQLYGDDKSTEENEEVINEFTKIINDANEWVREKTGDNPTIPLDYISSNTIKSRSLRSNYTNKLSVQFLNHSLITTDSTTGILMYKGQYVVYTSSELGPVGTKINIRTSETMIPAIIGGTKKGTNSYYIEKDVFFKFIVDDNFDISKDQLEADKEGEEQKPPEDNENLIDLNSYFPGNVTSVHYAIEEDEIKPTSDDIDLSIYTELKNKDFYKQRNSFGYSVGYRSDDEELEKKIDKQEKTCSIDAQIVNGVKEGETKNLVGFELVKYLSENYDVKGSMDFIEFYKNEKLPDSCNELSTMMQDAEDNGTTLYKRKGWFKGEELNGYQQYFKFMKNSKLPKEEEYENWRVYKVDDVIKKKDIVPQYVIDSWDDDWNSKKNLPEEVKGYDYVYMIPGWGTSVESPYGTEATKQKFLWIIDVGYEQRYFPESGPEETYYMAIDKTTGEKVKKKKNMSVGDKMNEWTKNIREQLDTNAAMSYGGASSSEVDADGQAVVDLARKEIGNLGGVKYKQWMNWFNPSAVSDSSNYWCAMFASWATGQIGAQEAGITTKSAGVASFRSFHEARGELMPGDGSYIPKPGDLILWGNAHIEIVSSADKDGYTTIGGNTGDVGYPAEVNGIYYGNVAEHSKYKYGTTWHPEGAASVNFVNMKYTGQRTTVVHQQGKADATSMEANVARAFTATMGHNYGVTVMDISSGDIRIGIGAWKFKDSFDMIKEIRDENPVIFDKICKEADSDLIKKIGKGELDNISNFEEKDAKALEGILKTDPSKRIQTSRIEEDAIPIIKNLSSRNAQGKSLEPKAIVYIATTILGEQYYNGKEKSFEDGNYMFNDAISLSLKTDGTLENAFTTFGTDSKVRQFFSVRSGSDLNIAVKAAPLKNPFISFMSKLKRYTRNLKDIEITASAKIPEGNLNLNEAVIAHQPTIHKYAVKYGVEKYEDVILAIMMIESGGSGGDPMQSSESKGLPPNTITNPEESIEQGVIHFKNGVAKTELYGTDTETLIQGYNYGYGFIDYVAGRGKKYSFEIASDFSKEKSGGVKVPYKNEISVPINGGWRYNYGNMFYVLKVKQYLK